MVEKLRINELVVGDLYSFKNEKYYCGGFDESDYVNNGEVVLFLGSRIISLQEYRDLLGLNDGTENLLFAEGNMYCFEFFHQNKKIYKTTCCDIAFTFTKIN